MSNRAQFTQAYGYGEVTNAAADIELLAAPTGNVYLYIEKLTVSVYEAAIGEGGICQIIDTNGKVFKTINTDGVKDVNFDWGNYGIRLDDTNIGLRAVVSGAQTKQASVSITMKGHLDNK